MINLLEEGVGIIRKELIKIVIVCESYTFSNLVVRGICFSWGVTF